MDNLCNWLVGEPTPLKHMKVNWYDYRQYMGKKFQTTSQLDMYKID